jgi:hypothetical protein
MPDWLIQSVNTSALIGVCLFGMWGTIQICSFLAPQIRQFFDSHADLTENLKTHNQTQSECLQRQTAMMHNIGQTLDGHGNILNIHRDQLDELGERVEEIHAHVVVRGCQPPPRRHLKPEGGVS